MRLNRRLIVAKQIVGVFFLIDLASNGYTSYEKDKIIMIVHSLNTQESIKHTCAIGIGSPGRY